MLPIKIPEQDLRKWQQLLNYFIWGNKHHRISHRILRLPTCKGELDILDIKFYCEAVNLANIISIFNSKKDRLAAHRATRHQWFEVMGNILGAHTQTENDKWQDTYLRMILKI